VRCGISPLDTEERRKNSLMALEKQRRRMRLQMLCKGDAQPLRKSELMLSKKIDAFTRAGLTWR
jgi:hypothetical protein